jgi:hypothetical protein
MIKRVQKPTFVHPRFGRMPSRPHGHAQANAVHLCGLTKTDAEDLLDWLERRGVHSTRFNYVPGQGFEVDFTTN